MLPLLRSAGVDIVITDSGVLRDCNPVYSGLRGLTASLSSRDHRKVIIADDGHGTLAGIVGSANPQDDQGSWSNAAVRLAGAPLEALLASELALARASMVSASTRAWSRSTARTGCGSPWVRRT
ncbi:MAG: hypothetical protein PVS2B3_06640 [Steroidobacteraceae bacterium]